MFHIQGTSNLINVTIQKGSSLKQLQNNLNRTRVLTWCGLNQYVILFIF